MFKKYEDKKSRIALLYLLGIGDVELEALKRLHYEVIVPNVIEIVDYFYARMAKHPEFRQFLTSRELIQSLKKTQANYLREMGIDCYSPTYFEERIRVGLAHARIGLPLSLYQAAYNLLHEAIVKHVPDTIKKTPDDYILCSRTLFSVVNLDMHLAIEAYHHVAINEVQQELEEVKNQSEDISVRANIDSLTGMYSRKYLMDHLKKSLATAKEDEPVTVLMADIDHFKKINDSYGHLIGDEVLKDVSARIRGCLRSFDFVGRYGGEEFLIVLQNTDDTEGRDIAERIRQRIVNSPVQYQNSKYPVSISIGLTQVQAGENEEKVIERADHALYNAKDTGRNRVVVFDFDGKIKDPLGRKWNSLR
jgi:diguanylate cyclase (GGDEF)-like protein